MFHIKLGLDQMRELMAKLGQPQDSLRIIHFAGTNGKGSSVVFLENLLMAQGYTVASTISPHLIHLWERFRFQGASIGKEDFEQLFFEVRSRLGMGTAAAFEAREAWPVQTTYFELVIALFFYWAAKLKPDFVLVETGLGGRLDATNIVKSEVSAITPISFDHQEYLGQNLKQIFFEKLGIAKANSSLFIGMQTDEVSAALPEYPLPEGVQVFKAGQDFYWQTLGQRTANLGNTQFSFPSVGAHVAVNRLGLLGAHQWDNALLALAIFAHLEKKNWPKAAHKVPQALEGARWPGRLQQIHAEKPEVWVDGAHNEAGMQALFRHIGTAWAGRKLLVAITWMQDKHLERYLPHYPGITYQPIAFAYPRAVLAEDLVKLLPHRRKPVDLATFITNLTTNQYAEYDLVLVCGSLYLVGAFLEQFQ